MKTEFLIQWHIEINIAAMKSKPHIIWCQKAAEGQKYAAIKKMWCGSLAALEIYGIQRVKGLWKPKGKKELWREAHCSLLQQAFERHYHDWFQNQKKIPLCTESHEFFEEKKGKSKGEAFPLFRLFKKPRS